MAGRPKARKRKQADGGWPAPVVAMGPEKAGAVLADLVADHDAPLKAIAERHGLTAATMSAFLDALRTSHVALYETVREVSASELLPLIETRLKQALQFMSPEKMAAASVRDLAVTVGVLTEKRALMRGEPTHIVSTDERRALHELLPAMMREAARRGMIVEGEFRDMTEAEARGADPGTRVVSTDTTTDYAPVRQKRSGRARPVGGEAEK